MNADELLEQLRRLVAEYENGLVTDSDAPDFLEAVMGRIAALDHWLSMSGAVPKAWQK